MDSNLGEARNELKLLNLDYKSGDMRCMSVPCQFLLTLSVLRKGFDYGEFADIYGVSRTAVTVVFKTVATNRNSDAVCFGNFGQSAVTRRHYDTFLCLGILEGWM